MKNSLLFDASNPAKNWLFRVEKTPEGKTILRLHNALAIGIYDPDSKALLFVVQPRSTAVSRSNPKGLLAEAVAGRFDRKTTPLALAIAEVREETGIRVREEQVRFLNGGYPVMTSPGCTTEEMYLAFVTLRRGQITNRRRKNFGAAHEGERTRRLFVPVSDLATMQFEDLKTFAIVQWFLNEIKRGGE